MKYPSEDNRFLVEHAVLLQQSYQHFLGQDLLLAQQPEDLARLLFHAPYVLLSHNTENDPIFTYANMKAIELFGYSWDEFIQLPSRLSAEHAHQADRISLLAEVNQKGYSKNYRGIRVAKSGQRFLINNAVVWNLRDSQGRYAGQAAKFADWKYL